MSVVEENTNKNDNESPSYASEQPQQCQQESEVNDDNNNNNNSTMMIVNGCSMNDGARILFATDEWFGTADHLLLDHEPIAYDNDAFCEEGKLMDGWETRRKRRYGHDFCIIQLSQRLQSITSIHIDTAYFTGNQTPFISIETFDFGNINNNSDDDTINIINKSSSSNSSTTTSRCCIDQETAFVTALPNATRRLLVQMKRRPPPHTTSTAAGDAMNRNTTDDTTTTMMMMNVDEYRGTCSTRDEIQRAEQACASIQQPPQQQQWCSSNSTDNTNDTNSNNNNRGGWTERLGMTPLRPGYPTTRYHTFDIPSTRSTSNSSDSMSTTSSTAAATHVRFNYFPDGGVARLRIYGRPAITTSTTNNNNNCSNIIPKQPLYMPITTGDTCTVIPYSECNEDIEEEHNRLTKIHLDFEDAANSNYNTNPNCSYIEISSSDHGGKGMYSSNQHYGTIQQLLSPTSGIDMSDGWETARQALRPKILQPRCGDYDGEFVDFGTLMEYGIIALGAPIHFSTFIHRIIIDTKHFKGNYPESVDVAGCCYHVVANKNDTTTTAVDWANNGDDDDTTVGTADNTSTKLQWFPILHRCRLSPHSMHIYDRHQIAFNTMVAEKKNTTTGTTNTTLSNRISHVRVRIFPDGGLSRVRIYVPSSSSSSLS